MAERCPICYGDSESLEYLLCECVIAKNNKESIFLAPEHLGFTLIVELVGRDHMLRWQG